METATLDRLSSGRLTLGVGIGGDQFASELSKTGEQLDARVRAQMLDESLAILTAAWSGEPVCHRGEHYTVDPVPCLTVGATWSMPEFPPGVSAWSAKAQPRLDCRWPGCPRSGHPG
jgi:alkanesulfonate monooxygenase SsuD/methylene tetrahydromethanopterin reductase-like flavin-dependent oxidoreductase (luciferase family)